jgi:hypothetical protein
VIDLCGHVRRNQLEAALGHAQFGKDPVAHLAPLGAGAVDGKGVDARSSRPVISCVMLFRPSISTAFCTVVARGAGTLACW